MKILKTVVASRTNPDRLSSKRTIAVLLVSCLVIVVIAHMFFDKTIEEYIYAGLVEVLIWNLGFIGSEYIANKLPGSRSKYQNNGRPDYQNMPQYPRTNQYPSPRNSGGSSYPLSRMDPNAGENESDMQ